jgi:hypothetical protein
VVRPGPRLSWTPNNLAVTAEGVEGAIEEAQSVGRLLDIYGKEIQVYDGDYIEGQHYSVRRVDNLNNSLLGGDITVTGDPEEGTITVTLTGNVQGANGGTIDKGPIGITLYPTVLTGNDASVIDLEGPGAEMVFNVTSSLLITDLKDVNGITKPLNGAGAPLVNDALGIPDGTTPRFTGKITGRTGLSSGAYTHREPATLTVELSAAGDYKFYTPAFKEDALALIKSKFSAGSPEVSKVTVTPAKISFTLTYAITAKTIKRAADATSVAAGFNEDAATRPLKGLIVNGLVRHGEVAPTALLVQGESDYYTLDQAVKWEGLVQNAFFGGVTATAEVTLPAKPGYTFEGTDITANIDLRPLFTSPDGTTQPSVDIISAGDSLVFKLRYYVPKVKIYGTTIAGGILAKDKLAVPVLGATVPKTLKIDANAPFTLGSFKLIGAASKYALGDNPVATVTLLAKDGYEFDDTGTSSPNLSVTSPLPNGAIASSNTGTVASNLINKLTVEISLGQLPTITIPALAANLVTSPTGIDSGEIKYNALQSSALLTSTTNTYVQALGAGGSIFTWTDGLSIDLSAFDYTDNSGKAVATVTLKPVDGSSPTIYTFYGYSTGADTVAGLKFLFTVGGYEPTVGTPRIEGNNLVFTLTYDIDKADLTDTTTELGKISDFSGPVPTAGSPVNSVTVPSIIDPSSLVTIGTTGATAPSWTGITAAATPAFSPSGTAKYTFYLIPDAGYQFINESSWNSAVNSKFTWGSSTTRTAEITSEGNLKIEVSWTIATAP